MISSNAENFSPQELSSLIDKIENLNSVDELKIEAKELAGNLCETDKIMRKQNQEFKTIYEVTSQISALYMDVKAMEKYLTRTIMGQFTVFKLLILRKKNLASKKLSVSYAQGISATDFEIPLSNPILQNISQDDRPININDISDIEELETKNIFQELGIEMICPLCLPESNGEEIEGLLCLGSRITNTPFTKSDTHFLKQMSRMIASGYANELLYRSSVTDDLTQIYSRGYFEARLELEINKIDQYMTGSLCLAMIDLDDFKKINDTYGHLAGDDALKLVAKILKDEVRDIDIVARYGGEEFTLILQEIEKHHAVVVLERIRKALESLSIPLPNSKTLNITASFGLTKYPTDANDKRTLICNADKAMYQAKRNNKNQVCVWLPDIETDNA